MELYIYTDGAVQPGRPPDDHGKESMPSIATVSTPTASIYARVEQVVGSHVERFGHREELVVAWSS
jgi:Uncharacterized protein conserved in bacteria (DUF2218)